MRQDRAHYERHHDDEIIDRITIEVVPRYKTSGLSGDEWRVSAVIKLWRKGEVMVESHHGKIADAVSYLPWLLRTWTEGGEDEVERRWIERIRKDEKTCHQPGCSEPATVVYSIKQRFSREGYEENPENRYGDARRAFCARHSTRGDCGLEDADRNYAVVTGETTPPRPEDEKPAVFGGVVVMEEAEKPSPSSGAGEGDKT